MPTPTRRRFLHATAVTLASSTLRAQDSPVLLPAKDVTAGPQHHWFGYYDKCPWNKSGRYLLAMESTFCDRQPVSGERITLGRVDLPNGNEFIPFDSTTLWSWQQGTMLQWYGGELEDTVVYNRYLEDHAAAVILNLKTNATRTLPRPIYALSKDGTQAISLDFARLHRLRPGYGYASLKERYADEPAPKELGIWHIDVATADVKQIITLEQLANHQADDRFTGAYHWVNHLQFNPGGTRFVFLHRWKRPEEKAFRTRMYTAKPDGSDLKILHDSGTVSHFDWRDDDTMLAWVKLKAGDAKAVFALLHIDGRPPEVVFDTEKVDGHCSYSPDRKWVLNDTYPDGRRMQHLMLLNVKTQRRFKVNQFHSPPMFTGPFRCDLHPRWNRDGTKVCFDGCHHAQRQLYVVDVEEIVKNG